MNTISAALAGPLPAEVEFGATVTSAPTFFTGATSRSRHEAFTCRTSGGTALEVVSNVDLAPPVPVTVGDRISVRGELVNDRGRGPLVHWTHHDPAGRHPGGWIDLHGSRYA